MVCSEYVGILFYLASFTLIAWQLPTTLEFLTFTSTMLHDFLDSNEDLWENHERTVYSWSQVSRQQMVWITLASQASQVSLRPKIRINHNYSNILPFLNYLCHCTGKGGSRKSWIGVESCLRTHYLWITLLKVLVVIVMLNFWHTSK